jgi:hypothetical protein
MYDGYVFRYSDSNAFHAFIFIIVCSCRSHGAPKGDVEVSAEARKWDNYCTVPAGSSNFTCRISIS